MCIIIKFSNMSLSQNTTSLELFEIPSLLLNSEYQSVLPQNHRNYTNMHIKERLRWGLSEVFDCLKNNFNLHYFFTNQNIRKFVVTFNHQILVTLSNESYIYFYLLAENKVMAIYKANNPISDFIMIENSNGILYYTASEVNFWNYKNKVVKNLVYDNFNRISTIAVSSNFKLIAVGYDDGNIYIIECENIDLKVVLSYHKNKISALTFSKDNNTLISAEGGISENPECQIGVWNVQKEILLAILVGHPFPVYTLKIDKKNKYLLSVSHDHSIRLWDLEQSLLYQNSSKMIVKPKYKIFEYKSNALENFNCIKSKYVLKKIKSVYDIYYYEGWKMYGKGILSQFKDKFEVSRLVFPSEWFNFNYSMIEVFYKSTCVIVFNEKIASIETYDIPNLQKQNVISLSGVGLPKIASLMSNKKIAVLNKNNSLHLINFLNQKGESFFLTGSNFLLNGSNIAKKRYLISSFRIIYTSNYTISVWDLFSRKFLGHYYGDSQPLPDVGISKNGEFLLLNTQSNVIKIINLETQTLIGRINTDEYILKNFGFTNDSLYIATYQQVFEYLKNPMINNTENKERNLNMHYPEKCMIFSFYEAGNCNRILMKRLASENSKIQVIKFRNNVYFSKPKSRLYNLCSTDELKFKIWNKKTWANNKDKKIGVIAQNGFYAVFKLNDGEICSLYDS